MNKAPFIVTHPRPAGELAQQPLEPAAREDLAVRLFTRAAGLTSAQRTELLDRECGSDSPLRAEVESLLEFHDPQSNFLEQPVLGDNSAELLAQLSAQECGGMGDGEPTVVAGTRIGQYTLTKVLGAGGMGVVYEAEQDMPRRRVAIKVVRPGLLHGHLTRRFRAEAHALARLQHPGIAQIYDAGTARLGGVSIPYLAMELVEGTSLTSYVKTQKLTMRASLELFLKITEAVSHAHQRGVIHRDLKPANVMVTSGLDGGQPKVLDFGIARLTQTSLATGQRGDAEGASENPRGHSPTHVTMVTNTGQVMGTLAYMSPEQAGGGLVPVDVRSDVYALGAMLYELLAGRPPLDLSACSLIEGVRRIADVEPSSLGTLDRSLRGDLENIVSKALEKEPSRRYQSAAELGEDLRRYLHDEPITARAPSTWYQLRKFTRRNRVLAGGVAAVIVALSAGLATTLRQSGLTREALARANAQQENTTQALQFLGEVISSGNPDIARGREPTLRDALEMAAVRLERGDVASSTVAASLNAELGRAFGGLGDYVRGEAMQRRALALEQQVYGDTSTKALARVSSVARFMELQGRAVQSQPMLVEAMQKAIKAHGPKAQVTFEVVAQMGNAFPPERGGLDFAKCAWKLGQQIFGDADPRTLMAESSYGDALTHLGKPQEGFDVLRACYEVTHRTLGADHPQTLDTGASVGLALLRLGRVDESCQWLERSLILQRKVLGQNLFKIIKSTNNVATAFIQGGQHERALELTTQSLADCQKFYTAPSRDELNARGLMTSALIGLHRFDAAEISAGEQLRRAEMFVASGTAAGELEHHKDPRPASKTVDAAAPSQQTGTQAPAVTAAAPETGAIAPGDGSTPQPPAQNISDDVVDAWALHYDLYEAWKKPGEQAKWRERIGATPRGKKLLEAKEQKLAPPLRPESPAVAAQQK